MSKSILMAAMAAVLGCAFLAAPAEAAPMSSVQVDVSSSEITPVQMYRRERMRRRYGMRRPYGYRGYRMERGGNSNARNPSRAPYQQNLGQTSGGYR